MAVYSKIYNYTLDLIENQFNEGDKLPGARRIAGLFSCSLPKVQAVLDSLEQSGVVEGRERSGTYVSKGYGCPPIRGCGNSQTKANLRPPDVLLP